MNTRAFILLIGITSATHAQVDSQSLRAEFLNSFRDSIAKGARFEDQVETAQEAIARKLDGTRIRFSEAAPAFRASNEAIFKETVFQSILLRHLTFQRDAVPATDSAILWRSSPGFIPTPLLEELAGMPIQQIPDVGLSALWRALQTSSNALEDNIVSHSGLNRQQVAVGTVKLSEEEQRELQHAIEDARLRIVAKRLLGEEIKRRPAARPNNVPEPTPPSVTPAAKQPSRQP